MHVVIVGCGRLGAELARSLAREGQDVTIVDEDALAFDRLGPDFTGRQVVGTGFDEDVLREAAVGEADMVAAMTDGDATNFMVAEAVRKLFGVQRVAVRVNDPEFEPVFAELGFCTVSLPALAERRVRELLDQNPC